MSGGLPENRSPGTGGEVLRGQLVQSGRVAAGVGPVRRPGRRPLAGSPGSARVRSLASLNLLERREHQADQDVPDVFPAAAPGSSSARSTGPTVTTPLFRRRDVVLDLVKRHLPARPGPGGRQAASHRSNIALTFRNAGSKSMLRLNIRFSSSFLPGFGRGSRPTGPGRPGPWQAMLNSASSVMNRSLRASLSAKGGMGAGPGGCRQARPSTGPGSESHDRGRCVPAFVAMVTRAIPTKSSISVPPRAEAGRAAWQAEQVLPRPRVASLIGRARGGAGEGGAGQAAPNGRRGERGARRARVCVTCVCACVDLGRERVCVVRACACVPACEP